MEEVFSTDPVVALHAAESLITHGPAAARAVVDRIASMGVVATVAAKRVVGAHPAETAPVMVERVLNAREDWHGAVAVPPCFSRAHATYATPLLVEHLNDADPDPVRLTIESLGYLGAEEWGFRLTELLEEAAEDTSDYRYRKYEYYAVLARGRMLRAIARLGSGPQLDLWAAYRQLDRLIRLAEIRSGDKVTIARLGSILQRAPRAHADLLISWVNESDSPTHRRLAVEALGGMGLKRTLPTLKNSLGDIDESVRDQAAFAIAGVGGPQSAVILEAAIPESSSAAEADRRRSALALCIADAETEDDFLRVAGDLLGNPPRGVFWVHRAIGIRSAARFVAVLKRGLVSDDPLIRGVSALALARLGGAGAEAAVRAAYDESSIELERIHAALGLVLLGTTPSDDADLEGLAAALSEESYLYDRRVQADIVEVLSHSHHPRALAMAKAWTEIYRHPLD